MIALAFDPRPIRLGENCGDLLFVQITGLRLRCLFGRDTQDRCALSSGQRFAVGDEAEEAVQRT